MTKTKDCWQNIAERLLGYYIDRQQGMPHADAIAKYKVEFDSNGNVAPVENNSIQAYLGEEKL